VGRGRKVRAAELPARPTLPEAAHGHWQVPTLDLLEAAQGPGEGRRKPGRMPRLPQELGQGLLLAGRQEEGLPLVGRQVEVLLSEEHQIEGHQVEGHQAEGLQVEGCQVEVHQVEGRQVEEHQ